VDCYFDTVDYSLAKKDYWLRTRDGQIELKMPLQRDSKPGNAIATTTMYKELTLRDDINLEIQVCGVHGEGGDNVEASLETLAEFRTHRKKYKWYVASLILTPSSTPLTRNEYCDGSGIFNIDIDTASGVSSETAGFDYHLCEIERMVTTTADVDAAEADIAAFADSLGLTADTSAVPGKIEVYLHQYKQKAHSALVDAGVMLPITAHL
jgi:hypothetical protein